MTATHTTPTDPKCHRTWIITYLSGPESGVHMTAGGGDRWHRLDSDNLPTVAVRTTKFRDVATRARRVAIGPAPGVPPARRTFDRLLTRALASAMTRTDSLERTDRR
jgi:hypothetical protein